VDPTERKGISLDGEDSVKIFHAKLREENKTLKKKKGNSGNGFTVTTPSSVGKVWNTTDLRQGISINGKKNINAFFSKLRKNGCIKDKNC
jgi:hypothetical protein